MDHYEFEAKVPVEHILHIVKTVRESGVQGNVGCILQCAGSALGELGAFIDSFKPEPVGTVLYGDRPVETLSLNEVCDALEAKFGVATAAEDDKSAIDPTTIALILQIVKLVWELWRNR